MVATARRTNIGPRLLTDTLRKLANASKPHAGPARPLEEYPRKIRKKSCKAARQLFAVEGRTLL